MDFSRQFLLGVLALGLQTGLAMALEPGPAAGTAVPGPPPAVIGSAAAVADTAAAAPANLPVGIAPLAPPTGLTPVPPQIGGSSAPGGAGVYWLQRYVDNKLASDIENTFGRGPPIPAGSYTSQSQLYASPTGWGLAVSASWSSQPSPAPQTGLAPVAGTSVPGMPPAVSTAAAAAPANHPVATAPLAPQTGPTPVPPQFGWPEWHWPSCCCCPSGRIIGGAAIYWVQPYVDNNPAYGIENTIGRGPGPTPVTPPGTRVDQFVDIRHHMDVAPLVWLGYMTDSGWGGRLRYWYLREGSNQTTAASSTISDSTVQIESASPLGISLPVPVTGSLSVTSELAMQFLDLEGMYELQAGRWDLLFSGGLRLVRIDQTYNAYGGGDFGGPGFFSLQSHRSFEGIGPTVALEVRRPFGCSGVSLYGSSHGSVVIGSANQQATITVEDLASQDHQDRGVPIGELEFGLEYDRQVGRARLFGQIALVGADWFAIGNASRSSPHLIPGGDFVGGGYNVDGDIALLGVCFRIGVNY